MLCLSPSHVLVTVGNYALYARCYSMTQELNAFHTVSYSVSGTPILFHELNRTAYFESLAP